MTTLEAALGRDKATAALLRAAERVVKAGKHRESNGARIFVEAAELALRAK